jgi:hypothetical protein
LVFQKCKEERVGEEEKVSIGKDCQSGEYVEGNEEIAKVDSYWRVTGCGRKILNIWGISL